jgi:hypothetical protein
VLNGTFLDHLRKKQAISQSGIVDYKTPYEPFGRAGERAKENDITQKRN